MASLVEKGILLLNDDIDSGNSLDVKYRRRKVKRKKSSLKVCQGLKAELDTVSPKITRNSRFKSRIEEIKECYVSSPELKDCSFSGSDKTLMKNARKVFDIQMEMISKTCTTEKLTKK